VTDARSTQRFPRPQRRLAQINIGRLRFDRSDERLAGWRDNIDRINRLAEAAPGFVWRLKGAEGEDTGARMWGDPRIVTNMSVWDLLKDFKFFVYRTAHSQFVRSRTQWFYKLDVHFALWWIDSDAYPILEEGKDKLDLLAQVGSSEAAFTLSSPYAAGPIESGEAP